MQVFYQGCHASANAFMSTTSPFNVQGDAVVKQELEIDGQQWLMTCVGMGNPHAITYGTTANPDLKVCDIDIECEHQVLPR